MEKTANKEEQGAKIYLAAHSGFCFGVKRAVEIAFKAGESFGGKKVYSLGEIIHNTSVVEQLKERGVFPEEDYLRIPKDAGVIIRAHGVPEKVYDYFTKQGIDFIDATCPFVRKIHKKVSEVDPDTGLVLIAGNAKHPEIIGITSFSRAPVFVFSSAEELEELFKGFDDSLRSRQIYLAAQTTFSLKEWESCVKKIKLLCTNPIIFDTICKATEQRQREADRLSRKCDAMVVIGCAHSSNTAKLFSLCSQNGPASLCEDAESLDRAFVRSHNTVGVTAGASTPPAIIKEVLEAMSEEKNTIVEDADDFDFAAALEENLSSMSSDQKVKGVVVGITPTEIQLDIGRKQTGYILYDEYSYDPKVNPAEDCKVGDELDVVIMKTNDAEGTIMLSKKRFDSARAWDELEKFCEDGTVLSGTVTAVVRGGLMVTTAKGLRVFIPASLAKARRSEPIDDMQGEDVSFKIIEVNKQRKRAVGSIKAVLADARREAHDRFWENAEVGQIYTGVVKSLTSYGAFVDIGGVDGMIHISELSWKRIHHPSDVLSVGDTVEVYIKALDNNKISLGYKRDEDNPWVILRKKYSVGDTVEVKIVGMTSFGAFANIIEGIDGLIHISQISHRHIEKPQDVLKIGQSVNVKITEIDYDKKRVSLSMRALISPEEEIFPEPEITQAEEAQPAEPEASETQASAPVEEAQTAKAAKQAQEEAAQPAEKAAEKEAEAEVVAEPEKAEAAAESEPEAEKEAEAAAEPEAEKEAEAAAEPEAEDAEAEKAEAEGAAEEKEAL